VVRLGDDLSEMRLWAKRPTTGCVHQMLTEKIGSTCQKEGDRVQYMSLE
jgi:hypothetical protein